MAKQTALTEGAKAPDFTLPTHTGEKISLKDFTGKKNVVLYFYPKDGTPGCTKEACSFRDDLKAFDRLNTVVLGVSCDGINSHQKFAGKLHLSFPLLSDEDAKVSKVYGVYKQKSLYGRKFMGIERTTFVIDKKGAVRKIFPQVKVEGHSREVLEFLQSNLP